jgi:hypothetical protein
LEKNRADNAETGDPDGLPKENSSERSLVHPCHGKKVNEIICNQCCDNEPPAPKRKG